MVYFSLIPKDGTLTFQSNRKLCRTVLRKKAGPLGVEGILHSIYTKHCFVLYNFHGMHFTSKKIDNNNYMLHFPLGIPLRATQDTELVYLGATKPGEEMDVHVEICDMSELSQRCGLCNIRTTNGQDFLIQFKYAYT